MAAAVSEQIVAPRKASGRKTSTLRIEASLCKKVQTITEDRGISVAEYIEPLIRATIERDWLKIVKRAADAEAEAKGQK